MVTSGRVIRHRLGTDDAADAGPRHTVQPGEFGQRHAMGAFALNGLAVDVQRLTPDVPALELGPAHAAPYALDDQVALQFGDGTDDDDDGPPERATGVDVLPER